MKKAIISFTLFLWLYTPTMARSPFRKKDPHTPEIIISWKNSPIEIKHVNWVYKKYPLFNAFNKKFFYDHLLPKNPIPSISSPGNFLNPQHIDKTVNNLIHEIKKHKKTYTDFELLKDRNFNYKKKCGLLILKFKHYPLVLKLFMETPKTFIDPYCKGFENQFFFYMSGGNNRHIAGLTRIKNLELIHEQINNNPQWLNKIITPRKWYWLPKRPRWIVIKGHNIGEEKQIMTEIPSTYAIIADELDTTEELNGLSSLKKSEIIMQLCMDLHLFVDPHADNFILKYNPQTDDYMIHIVDTEHFPSMVGLKEEPFFNNHIEWYLYLGAKFFQDAFLQTKQSRRKAQYTCSPCEIKW